MMYLTLLTHGSRQFSYTINVSFYNKRGLLCLELSKSQSI